MVEVADVLVCPISKQPMIRAGDTWHAPSGLLWRNGDFRVPLDFSPVWASGQEEYERFTDEWFAGNDADPSRMEAVDAETRDVYAAIPLEGDVLDVGGHFGTALVQAGVSPERYLCVDPMAFDVVDMSRRYPRYVEHYAAAASAPRVQANAEFLPLRDLTFDTVHMRSCVDHFAAPHLAMLEAFRVLRPGGAVVVGLALEGAYRRAEPDGNEAAGSHVRRLRNRAVRAVKERPGVYARLERVRGLLGHGYHDHHVFHPTLDGLRSLLAGGGFTVEKEVWQAAYHNVVYVRARKPA